MTTYEFPIANVRGNELITNKGEKSYFYKLDSFDQEQKELYEIDSIYQKITESCKNLGTEYWYKFYRIGRENYLNTNEELTRLGLDYRSCENPLKIFFGVDDIYSNLGIYDDYLLYNGKYKRILSVRGFKTHGIDQSFLPRDIDYVLAFKRLSNELALKKLERIRTAQKVSLVKNKRDFEGEGAYFQAESLIEDLTHSHEAIFEMELAFIVEADSLNDLNLKTNELISELKLLGIPPILEGHSLKICKTGLYNIFKGLIVGVEPEFKYRNIPNKIGHLKYLIPINKSKLMRAGITLHDLDGDEIFFNPFSDIFKSKNMLVTGSTGGGKSVWVNKLVHSLVRNHPVVIIDKGGSFKKLCSYHGGHELGSFINPMQFNDPMYLREMILSMVEKSLFGKLEKGKLLKLIKAYLESNSKRSFWGLISFIENSGFEGINHYFEDVRDFITDEVKEINNFLYVDIEKYPKSLISLIIIYSLEYFKNQNKKEKILVFDECWSFLKDHGEYIEECFRTFRKTGAFPIAISQGMTDFNEVGGSLNKAITNNSFFKVFFPQEYIVDKGISEFDNHRISSLQFEKGKYSECYLKSEDNKIRKIVRIYLSPLEFEVFNTDPSRSDKLFKFLDEYKSYFSNVRECFDSFVRLQHG